MFVKFVLSYTKRNMSLFNRNLRISLVICTYNRDQFIGEALDSLVLQTLGKEKFEIVIVNNNCTDNTDQICQKFIQQHPELDINYVIETNQGLSFARNRGIAEAKYEIITYIDDDAYAKANFLELIYDYFNANPDTAGLGGKVTPRYEIKEPKWMNKYLYGFVTKVDLGEQIRKFRPGEYPAGCNMTYRKDLLQEVGGFNNKLKWRADDKYINFKIREVSDQIIYIPLLEVEHTIDDYRTSDENFKKLSFKFGSEESIRVRDEGTWSFLKKIAEFMFKLAGSFVLMLRFILKGQSAKGRYTFLYRWLATKGLLFPDKQV